MTAPRSGTLGVALDTLVTRSADLRLGIPAVATWVAAGVATGVPAAIAALSGGVLAAAAVASAVAAVLIRRTGRNAGVLGVVVVALALAALVALLAAIGLDRRSPEVLTTAARSSATVSLEVEQRGPATDGRVAVVIRAVRVPATGRTIRVDSPALLFLEPGVETGRGLPGIGGRIDLLAGMRRTGPGDEVAFTLSPRGPLTVRAVPPPLLAATDGLRSGFAATAAALPGDGGRLLPGLAVGDTSAVPPELADAMKAASLTHLTAVSGSNCAVVVALATVVLGAAGAPRLLRIAVALGMLGAFVVLVTPQPSVVRAAAMSTLVLVALALGRPVRGVPLLGTAVIALLASDPWLARDYGFALSVLATAGLLLLAPPLAARLARVMPPGIALAIAVPVAAQIACQPVLLLLAPAVPLYGVPANLLAEPAAPLATVIGLAACLLSAVSPPIASALAAVAWVPSAWIAAVARTCAGLPAAQLPWPPGVGGALVMALLLAAGLLVASSRVRGRLRVAAGAVLLLGLAGWLGAVAGSSVATSVSRPGDWEYALCDVGQGDATVIRSAGAVALVDTGPDPARLARCLHELGIGRIALLVLTHYDLDHVGGTSAVVGRVDRALIGPSSGADDDRVAAEVRAGGARVDPGRRGLSGTLGDLRWRVLWPPDRGVEPGNPASVTLSVEPGPGCVRGCLSGLLLGDLGEESQARLLGIERLGRYDVVKVAHHGSADQDPALYARIRATVGLIGVGAGNRYGHPTAAALGVLADAGTAAFRSDRDGLVLVAGGAPPSDAGPGAAPTVRVWTERGG